MTAVVDPILGHSPVHLFKLSVERYHEMIRTGAIREDDRVELISGCLVAQMPKDRLHRVTTHKVRKLIESLIGEGYYVDSQEPISLEDSEPEPDGTVIRGRVDDFEAHPLASDVAMVIEVANSSLEFDSGAKRLLYATAGIPIYWVVNLIDRTIDVFTSPAPTATGKDYAPAVRYAMDQAVPLVVDGKQLGEVRVADVIG
jgi:hypothetical protein